MNSFLPIAVLNSPTFNFSPAYFLGLHQRIFEGIFPHAGHIRSVELTKHEEVLNGATVEYEFLKVLLYGDEIELKNRHLRIGFEYGSPAGEAVSKLHRRPGKLDIGDGKLDIDREKLDIDGLSAPTQANIKKLREAFATVEFFKRADALKVLNLTPTAVSNLLSRMNQLGLIAPVSGHGKGAWRFDHSVLSRK